MGENYVPLGEREVIQSRLRERDCDDWAAVLKAADVPFAPIVHWSEAMGTPHAQANGVMTQYQYRGHTVKVPVVPVSVTPGAQVAQSGYAGWAQAHRDKVKSVRPPPTLGEHNAQILRELGLSS